jgi:DNA-binding MarR family transcriptional regulator
MTEEAHRARLSEDDGRGLPAAAMARDVVAEDRERWKELGLPAPEAVAAFMALLRSQVEVVAAARRALDPTGLSVTDYAALSNIRLSADGSQTLARIADRLLISPARCGYVIDRLEHQKLVHRRPHPTDRRTTLAVLTRKGLQRVAEADAAMSLIQFGFEGVDRANLVAIVAALRTTSQSKE